MIGRHRFREGEVKQQCSREAERRGKEERHVNAPLAENPADRWSKNESQPKRGADQSHAFRAVLFGGDVGDVGLRGRDVSASDAVEYAADKEHKNGGG